MSTISESSALLRRSLMGNAIFSTTSAFAFLLFHRNIAEFIGLGNSMIVLAVGVSLLVFGLGLFRNALRANPNLMEAMLAIVMDLAWVLGSAVVLLLNFLNSQGNWTVAVIADIVLVFAILQWIGLRRMRNFTNSTSVT